MAELIKDFLASVPNLNEIIVTRHGESAGQKNQSLYKSLGDDNIPLTNLGVEQALIAGESLKALGFQIVAIDHSTSLRATQTANNIAKAYGLTPRKVIPNPLVDKQSFGKFDGLFSDAEKSAALPDQFRTYKAAYDAAGPMYARPPQGESLSDVVERIGLFLRTYGQQPDQPRLVVTHGTDDLIIEALLTGKDQDWLLSKIDSVKNVELFHFQRGDDGHFEKTTLEDHPVLSL